MNRVIEKSCARVNRQIGLVVILLVICSLEVQASRESTIQDDGILRPPMSNLLAVHWPDLTKLETSVREQVASLQNSLADTVRNPRISAIALGEAYGRMGEVYHAYSFVSQARDCYLNASRLMTTDFRWAYLLAKLDHQEGRFDEAMRRYRLAQTLRFDYIAVPVNLGNIYLELNRLEEASESFKAALEIDKSNAAAHYGLGQVALSRRSYTEAVDNFETALAQAPAANRIHYSLAMAYRGLGNSERARAHLAQQGPVGVRVPDPLVERLQDLIQGERVHLIRGKLALEAQRYPEAAVEFRKAIAANAASVTARLNLGVVLIRTGDPKGAAEQFAEALSIEPNNSNAHYNLAVLLAEENKHAQAINHLLSVLRVDPDDLSARFLLARELMRSERPDEALVEFSRVVQADPDNEVALLEQVKLLYRQREYKQALDSLERGHAKYPQKGRTVIMLAYLLAASPKFDLRDGARALGLARLIYETTRSLQHGALVAMALAELGRCNEAAEWQRRMIAGAGQEGNTNLLAMLKAGLKQYEDVQPCRPSAETLLMDLLLPEKSR